jgi:hypothetical protein
MTQTLDAELRAHREALATLTKSGAVVISTHLRASGEAFCAASCANERHAVVGCCVMTDIRAIARDIKAHLSGLDNHLVSGLRRFEWKPEDGLLDLIVRAAVPRQHDGLKALADLVIAERGDAATILLRPACEKFIVLKYLVSIDRADADLLLKCLAKRHISFALEAQNEYSGADVMKDLGLDRLLPERAQPLARDAERAKGETWMEENRISKRAFYGEARRRGAEVQVPVPHHFAGRSFQRRRAYVPRLGPAGRDEDRAQHVRTVLGVEELDWLFPNAGDSSRARH